MQIIRMRCDYMENPIGFDLDHPSLGWVVAPDGRGTRQTAYHLQVSISPGFETLCYDSGEQPSNQSVGVRLDMALAPCTRYFWRVRVWDENGNISPFSEAAFFETGRMGAAWEADWITGPEFPQLRTSFTLDKPVRSARVYACGVGLYRMFLNGTRVGDEELTPNFNAYDQWLQYQTYDITAQLQIGENVWGAWLGNGYYKGRVNWPGVPERRNIYGDAAGFIGELAIVYADGSTQRVHTGSDWRAARSPFLRAEIYDGEVYDARTEQAGWNAPGFDDSGWEAAGTVSIDKALLTARKSVPVRVTKTLQPLSLIHTPLGEQVLDFGQNFAGWVRFTTDAPEGTELLIQFGEALDKDGNFYRENMRTALAEIRYIAAGGEAEYAPTFTFFGFRYARVAGWPGDIPLRAFAGEVIHSDIRQTGAFTCSDERVNRLFLNAMWGQRSNFVDVPTDCPQRDERMGWTGDAQVFCATACMNMESDAFYRKYLFDLALEQRKAGHVPVVVPNILYATGYWKLPTTGWGDAATIIPWTLYQYYGDKAVLEAQYDSMKAWVEYMRACDTGGTDRYGGFHLGDWLAQDTKDPDSPYGLTPTDLIATAYYAYSTDLLAKAARVLAKDEDAQTYGLLAERIRAAFRREFISPNGRVVSETQTAQVIALAMDLALPEQRPVIVAHLAERLRVDKVKLTTGFLGTPYLCPVLSDNGLNAYAYALLLQTACPGWLFAVERGATTIWERWNSIKEDGSFGPVSMNSLNHYAYGAIAEWMYRYVAGINPVDSAPGFKHIRLAPMPNDMLSFAEASIDTQYGTVQSRWELNNGRLHLRFEIPFNATATIILPDAENADIVENGQIIHGRAFERGAGVWTYSYIPNGDTICSRVPSDTSTGH